MNKYRKKPESTVIAVQLNLETDGFTYEKWGSTQRCESGDWLLNNNGDVYTVSRDSFAKTYKELSPGNYFKTTSVLAEVADKAGEIATKEGVTHYKKGDYIVFNDEDQKDGYAISKDKFDDMYELVENRTNKG